MTSLVCNHAWVKWILSLPKYLENWSEAQAITIQAGTWKDMRPANMVCFARPGGPPILAIWRWGGTERYHQMDYLKCYSSLGIRWTLIIHTGNLQCHFLNTDPPLYSLVATKTTRWVACSVYLDQLPHVALCLQWYWLDQRRSVKPDSMWQHRLTWPFTCTRHVQHNVLPYNL